MLPDEPQQRAPLPRPIQNDSRKNVSTRPSLARPEVPPSLTGSPALTGQKPRPSLAGTPPGGKPSGIQRVAAGRAPLPGHWRVAVGNGQGQAGEEDSVLALRSTQPSGGGRETWGGGGVGGGDSSRGDTVLVACGGSPGCSGGLGNLWEAGSTCTGSWRMMRSPPRRPAAPRPRQKSWGSACRQSLTLWWGQQEGGGEKRPRTDPRGGGKRGRHGGD